MLIPLSLIVLLAGGADVAATGCGAPALWADAASAPDAEVREKINTWLAPHAEACRVVHAARTSVASAGRGERADARARFAAAARTLNGLQLHNAAAAYVAVLQSDWYAAAHADDAARAALDAAAAQTGVPPSMRPELEAHIALHRAQFLLAHAGRTALAPKQKAAAYNAALAHIDGPLAKSDASKNEVLQLRHRALVGLDRGHDAHETAALLWSEHPASPQARALEPKTAIRDLPRDALLRRVASLIKASRMERAALDALAAPRRGEVDPELEALTVKALVRAGRVNDALNRAERYQQRLPDDDTLLQALAWTYAKANRNDDASARYRTLSERTPERTGPRALAGEACFLSAFLLFEKGARAEGGPNGGASPTSGFDAARSQFAQCSPVLVGHDREASALWYRALMNLSEEKYAQADADLKKLLEKHPGDPEVRKHQYWRAHTLARTGHPAAALRMYRRLARRYAVDYYGLRARAALAAPPTSKTPPLVAPRLDDDHLLFALQSDARTKRAALLFALGFKPPAQAAARITAGPATKLKLADVARSQLVGDFFRGYRSGPRVLQTRADAKGHLTPSKAWRAPYARPHAALVKRAASAAGLDVSMAYAIMRTESGFLEDAVSSAGAVGLMQLMPYTARGMAKKAGVPAPRFDEVMSPDAVVTLGTLFLAASEKEFGSKLLAAACYNAGPQNVAPWLDALAGLDAERFIERIPYRETRQYVKKVLATEALYRALDTGGPVRMAWPANTIPAAPQTYTSFRPDDNE